MRGAPSCGRSWAIPWPNGAGRGQVNGLQEATSKFKDGHHAALAGSESVRKLSSVHVANLLSSVVVFSVSTILCDETPQSKKPCESRIP